MSPDQVAVVTGAGSGLGRLITIALAERGWQVAAAGRRLPPLKETARLSPARKVLPVQADVGDAEQVAALFERVSDRFGRLDLLVNNAGTGAPPGAVDELAPDGWHSIVATNLTGSYLCAHHAVRMMKAQRPQGGRIINNGSISAHAPRPGSVGYTVTKHAITGLTKSISLDGRPYHIACGQIDIGNAATRHDPGHRRGRASGGRHRQARADVRRAARGRCGRVHGRAAARRERSVPDDHGHQYAVHRPRLSTGGGTNAVPRPRLMADRGRGRTVQAPPLE